MNSNLSELLLNMSGSGYRYRQFLFAGRRLPITVFVGVPDQRNCAHPYVLSRVGQAEVRFPSLVISHEDVAHEGVHLVMWAIKELTSGEIDRLVPKTIHYKSMNKSARKEEAMARLMDKFINRFYLKAELNGLSLSTEDWTRDEED